MREQGALCPRESENLLIYSSFSLGSPAGDENHSNNHHQLRALVPPLLKSNSKDLSMTREAGERSACSQNELMLCRYHRLTVSRAPGKKNNHNVLLLWRG